MSEASGSETSGAHTSASDTADVAVEQAAHGNPALFVGLILMTLLLSALLIGGFWGDDEAANDLTPLQADIEFDDTGENSPVPDPD